MEAITTILSNDPNPKEITAAIEEKIKVYNGRITTLQKDKGTYETLQQNKKILIGEKNELEDLACLYLFTEVGSIGEEHPLTRAEFEAVLKETFTKSTTALNGTLSASELLEKYWYDILDAARLDNAVIYLQGTPPPTGAGGEHAVTLTASDGIADTEQILTITVPNKKPVFTGTPATTAEVKTKYEYDVTVKDDDGDPLIGRLKDGPEWLALTDSYTYTWTMTKLLTDEKDNISAEIEKKKSSKNKAEAERFQPFLIIIELTDNEEFLAVFQQNRQRRKREQKIEKLTQELEKLQADKESLRTLLQALEDIEIDSELSKGDFINALLASENISEDLLAPYQDMILNDCWVPVLAGTPTAAGLYPVVLTVDDGSGPVEQCFVISVGEDSNIPPEFSSMPLPSATQTLPYTAKIEVSDDDSDDEDELWLWADTTLPSWLAFGQKRKLLEEHNKKFRPIGIAVAANGTIYASDIDADATDKSSGRIWTVSTSGQCEIFASSCGKVEPWVPMGLALDDKGTLFVADPRNNRICACNTSTKTCSPFVEGLTLPMDVAVDTEGGVYIANTGAHMVLYAKQTDDDVALSSIGGSFHSIPYGIAVDRRKNVYVADVTLNEEGEVVENGIYKLAPGASIGELITSLTAMDEQARPVPGFPQGLTVDTFGNLHAADKELNRIQQVAVDTAAFTITPDSPVSTVAWDRDGALTRPHDVAAAPDGSLYIADTNNRRILHLSAPSWELTGTPLQANDVGDTFTLSVSDWASPPVSKTFTLKVEEAKWVTFTRGKDAKDCSGKYWVNSEDHPCEDSMCADIQILWESSSQEAQKFTIYSQPASGCNLSCTKETPIVFQSLKSSASGATPTPSPDPESSIFAYPGDTFRCFFSKSKE